MIYATVFLLLVTLLPGTILADSAEEIKGRDFALSVNEGDIRVLTRSLKADLSNQRAVFVEILRHLPPIVQVYPTENYYYFHFIDRGLRYAGNIRLAQPGIAKGKVMFNYFVATTSWHYDDNDHFVILGADDGVIIISHSPLEYSITVDGMSVRFQMNDLSNVYPPSGMLNVAETYIGPVFDESGMEFYLIYNSVRHRFAFILNEASSQRDQYTPLTPGSRFQKGLRTGFVYWWNKAKNRRLLVSVFNQNVELNNALDGPFDQLPDNFIKGKMLYDAILDARPDLKGSIDRYGNFSDADQRYLVSPYMHYDSPKDLVPLERCAKMTSPASIEDCIAYQMPKP